MKQGTQIIDCPFCRIANKTVDAVIVWEDSDVVAFLDVRPIREGHCQIIPKQHVETFEQMSPDLAGKVLSLGQRLAQRMKAVYKVNRIAFLFTGVEGNMSIMFEVYYKAPPDLRKETELTVQISRFGGHLTFRENPDEPPSSGSLSSMTSCCVQFGLGS